MPDGYLNTHYQVLKPDQRWTNLARDHEMYCAGHLIQAAVAHFRATGKTSLLDVARRFADHILDVFGPGKRDGYPGHPEIEMALVELYRVTGEKRYLDLAQALIDRRGQRKMEATGSGAHYHQDHLPVREAGEVVGHAVRQLYLNAGVTDLYLETGDKALLDAQLAQWLDMTGRKIFITGGHGARHRRGLRRGLRAASTTCYCETCAAIAAIMWNWRLLLATGEARFADQLERALYNGFLSGISLDGQRYFYVNPLQSPGGIERHEWFGCACCPPNVMRQIASVQHFAATWDEGGVQIHQYLPGTIRAARPDGSRLQLEVKTRFPWDGRVEISVVEAQRGMADVSAPARLGARMPLKVNGEPANLPMVSGSYARVNRALQAGDQVSLELSMEPYYVQPNPRVDDLRGSLAIQRGPLIYCLEQADQPENVNLLDAGVNPYLPLQDAWQAGFAGRGDDRAYPRGAARPGGLAGQSLPAQRNGAGYPARGKPDRRALLCLGQPRSRRHAGLDPTAVAMMILDRFRLTDQVAVITGGNRGLGLDIAEALAEAGADIVSVQHAASAPALAAACGARRAALPGGRRRPERRPPPPAGCCAAALAAFGRVDILVNNAGIQRRTPSENFPLADWDEVMAINLRAVFVYCQTFGRHFLAQGGGKIINIASVQSLIGGWTIPAYTASKHGMAGLTKTLCNEWAGRGININCIAPGYMDTEMTAALQGRPRAQPLDQCAHPRRALGPARRPGRGGGFPGLPGCQLHQRPRPGGGRRLDGEVKGGRMNSRERVLSRVNHRAPDRVPLDLGASAVTGMHVSSVYLLRQALKLDPPGTPVKVIEPYQMLGEIAPDLMDALGVDVLPLGSPRNPVRLPQRGLETLDAVRRHAGAGAGGLQHRARSRTATS